jgi:hypothetical protein
VIDNRPLQAAAWAELAHARKRLEKATHDLHRHEDTDEPAFRAWLAATFPQLVNTARDLVMQVETKRRLLEAISREAFFSGRSEAAVWREWQRYGGQPPPMKEPPLPEEPPFPDESDFNDVTDADGDQMDKLVDEELKRLLEAEGIDEDDPMAGAFRDLARGMLGFKDAAPPASADAKAIYRRLVQRLHPDRGGEWTPARARVWEQVQEAWNARDADWLARLEAEWDAATDVLGPTSALGRLRAALEELVAARRDADKKLRLYRKTPAWRFSLRPVPEALLVRTGRQLQADCAALREELEDMVMTLTNWERASRRKERGKTRARRDEDQVEFGWGF